MRVPPPQQKWKQADGTRSEARTRQRHNNLRGAVAHARRHRTNQGRVPHPQGREAFAAKADAETLTGMDFDPGKGKMLFRDAAAIWLESRKADTRNNAENHRYALAPAATRRGDGKTLGIDAVFGGYPLNKITREYIQAWVNRLTEAGKKPSTVRHAFWTVRMVLEQAVVDGRLAKNPAEYIKLPTETGTNGGQVGVVVDRAQFLTPAQVSALVDATPWPYNVLVHVAAWAGLRAAELGGLHHRERRTAGPAIKPERPGEARRVARRAGGAANGAASSTARSRPSRATAACR